MIDEDDPPPARQPDVLDEAEDPQPLQVVQGSLDGAEAQAGGCGERLVAGIAIGLAPGELAQEDLEQEPPGSFEAGAAQELAFEGAARNPPERPTVNRPRPCLRTAIGSGIDPGIAAS